MFLLFNVCGERFGMCNVFFPLSVKWNGIFFFHFYFIENIPNYCLYHNFVIMPLTFKDC